MQSSTPVKFDSGRAYEHLRRQVAFSPRPAGSAALAQCREYIVSQLKAAGIAVREEAFDVKTPIGQTRMVNVIATIPGRRPERIALATHYDTKLFREFRFVGASDGASSTAAVLELGRVLKARQNEFTIELPRPAVGVVDKLIDKGIIPGVRASRIYPREPKLANHLIVAATELNTDADMDAYAKALKETV